MIIYIKMEVNIIIIKYIVLIYNGRKKYKNRI